jgi:thiamine biosynthesis protein ThiS
VKVIVNGESHEIDERTTVFELLESLALDPDAMVVERNGLVLERERYDDTVLGKGDVLEVLRFVGGG